MILSVDGKGADLKQTDAVEKRQTAGEATMFCPRNGLADNLAPDPIWHRTQFGTKSVVGSIWHQECKRVNLAPDPIWHQECERSQFGTGVNLAPDPIWHQGCKGVNLAPSSSFVSGDPYEPNESGNFFPMDFYFQH